MYMNLLTAVSAGLGAQERNPFVIVGNWFTCIGLGLVMAFLIIGVPNIIARALAKKKKA